MVLWLFQTGIFLYLLYSYPMKKLLFFLALLFAIDASFSQSWCMPGAVWNYRFKNKHMSYEDGYSEVRYVGDVLLDGRNCNTMKLSRYGVYGPNGTMTLWPDHSYFYTYAENNVVYYRRAANVYDTIVDFNAAVGDEWLIHEGWNALSCGTHSIQQVKLTVTDTGHMTINGFSLKYIEIANHPSGDGDHPTIRIVERIGPLRGFMNHYLCCAFDCWQRKGNFSCYWDDTFPVYSDPELNYCNINTVGLVEEGDPVTVTIFPNPTNGIVRIQASGKAELQIFNMTGEIVFTKDDHSGSEIDLGFLPPGIYTVSVKSRDSIHRAKLIKH